MWLETHRCWCTALLKHVFVHKPCHLYSSGNQIFSNKKSATYIWNIPKTWKMVFLEIIINLPADKGKKGNRSCKKYFYFTVIVYQCRNPGYTQHWWGERVFSCSFRWLKDLWFRGATFGITVLLRILASAGWFISLAPVSFLSGIM
jgi:hypothetical protein